MAPHLGTDLSYVTDVDPRIDALDGNRVLSAELAEQGQRAGPVPADSPSKRERDRMLAGADVLLVGYPVPLRLADRATALRWVHHTQAGVSNLVRSDLWTSTVPLTSSRGAVAVNAIAEYIMAGVFHFARGLHAATRTPPEGVLNRDRYHLAPVAGSTLGVVGLGGIGGAVARIARAVGMHVVGTRRSVTVNFDFGRLPRPERLDHSKPTGGKNGGMPVSKRPLPSKSSRTFSIRSGVQSCSLESIWLTGW
jgi:phosphoglycerate dehydrogenase-like enzyme